ALAATLRSARQVWRALPINHERKPVLMIRIADREDVRVVVAVSAKRNSAGASRWAGLAIEPKSCEVFPALSIYQHRAGPEHVLAVGRETEMTACLVETALPGLWTAHQLFTVNHHNVLIAGARAVRVM